MAVAVVAAVGMVAAVADMAAVTAMAGAAADTERLAASSKKLLRELRYSRAHIKSMQRHHVRGLLASRKAILKKCVDLENELREPAALGHRSHEALLLRQTLHYLLRDADALVGQRCLNPAVGLQTLMEITAEINSGAPP